LKTRAKAAPGNRLAGYEPDAHVGAEDSEREHRTRRRPRGKRDRRFFGELPLCPVRGWCLWCGLCADGAASGRCRARPVAAVARGAADRTVPVEDPFPIPPPCGEPKPPPEMIKEWEPVVTSCGCAPGGYEARVSCSGAPPVTNRNTASESWTRHTPPTLGRRRPNGSAELRILNAKRQERVSCTSIRSGWPVRVCVAQGWRRGRDFYRCRRFALARRGVTGAGREFFRSGGR